MPFSTFSHPFLKFLLSFFCLFAFCVTHVSGILSPPPTEFLCCSSLGYNFETATLFTPAFNWVSTTIEFWVAFGDIPYSAPTIITKGTTLPVPFKAQLTGNSMDAGTGSSSWTEVFIPSSTLNGAPSTLTWRHLAFIRSTSGGGSIAYYLDGVPQPPPFVSPSPLGSENDNSAPFSICNLSQNLLVTEVRVWDIELNNTQINARWNTRLTGTEPNLFAYWPLITDLTSGSGGPNLVGTGSAEFASIGTCSIASSLVTSPTPTLTASGSPTSSMTASSSLTTSVTASNSPTKSASASFSSSGTPTMSSSLSASAVTSSPATSFSVIASVTPLSLQSKSASPPSPSQSSLLRGRSNSLNPSVTETPKPTPTPPVLTSTQKPTPTLTPTSPNNTFGTVQISKTLQECLTNKTNWSECSHIAPTDVIFTKENSTNPTIIDIITESGFPAGQLVIPPGLLSPGCVVSIRQGEEPASHQPPKNDKCGQRENNVQPLSVIVEIRLNGNCEGIEKENPEFEDEIQLRLVGLDSPKSHCTGFYQEGRLGNGNGNGNGNKWKCLSDREETSRTDYVGENGNGFGIYNANSTHFTTFAVLFFDYSSDGCDVLWIISVSLVAAAIVLTVVISVLHVYCYTFRAFVGGFVGVSIDQVTTGRSARD